MYEQFYHLSAIPFQLTPDSRFFFGSSGHSRAISHLVYGLAQQEGFIVITGEVGAGKTTLVEQLWSQLDRNSYVMARIVTTRVSGDDLLRLAVAGFGVPDDGGADKATLLRDVGNIFYSTSLDASAFQSGLSILVRLDSAGGIARLRENVEEYRGLVERELELTAALKNAGPSEDAEGLADCAAIPAGKAVRPAGEFKISRARRVIGKLLLELRERSGERQIVTLEDVHGGHEASRTFCSETNTTPGGCLRQPDRHGMHLGDTTESA